jgi:hypothetical protein
MSLCACDLCDDDGDPRLDGYCAACNTTCYCPGTLGGRSVRMAMSRETRLRYHAVEAATTRGHVATRDPWAPAKGVATDVLKHAGKLAVDAATPLAKQAMEEAIKAVRKRISR